MKRSRKPSRRRKFAKSSESWDQHRFLETAFVPMVTEDGAGPLIDDPQYDFVLIHGVAFMNLCQLPIRRDGQKQIKVSGEQQLVTNGYLIAERTQLASWQNQGIVNVTQPGCSRELVFNRLIPIDFNMRDFVHEHQTPEAEIIADLRPFA